LLPSQEPLKRIGDDNTLLENLISIFLDDGSGKVAALRRALAHENFETIAWEALSSKGSAGDISSQRLFACVEELERAAETEDHRKQADVV